MTTVNGYALGFDSHIQRAKSQGRLSVSLHLGRRAAYDDRHMIAEALNAIEGRGFKVRRDEDWVSISWETTTETGASS